MADTNAKKWAAQIKELDELLGQLPDNPKLAPNAKPTEEQLANDFFKAKAEDPPPPAPTGMFGSGAKLSDYLKAQERLFKHVPQPALVEFSLYRDQTGWVTADMQIDVPSSKAVDGITRIKAWEADAVSAIDSLITQYDKAVEEWAEHQEFLRKEQEKQAAKVQPYNEEFQRLTNNRDIQGLANLMRGNDWLWSTKTTERHLLRCAKEWGVGVPPL